MKKMIFGFRAASLFVAFLVAGCQSNDSTAGNQSPSMAKSGAPVVAATLAEKPAANIPPVARMAVRVKAGGAAFTDSSGNIWVADQGFAGGETIERPELSITNTMDPGIYRSEHYGMDSFSWPLPDGKYLVKLHFCETFEGIAGPGERVFSFSVQGHEFKDFDVWAKAGGPLRAYVETVPAEIKNGKLLITFTSNIENPQVNGIEIIPQP